MKNGESVKVVMLISEALLGINLKKLRNNYLNKVAMGTKRRHIVLPLSELPFSDFKNNKTSVPYISRSIDPYSFTRGQLFIWVFNKLGLG